MMRTRMAGASAALDIETGGGEVLATVTHPPAVMMATEPWPPNVERARRNLLPLGAAVVVADDTALPFPASSFDLVVSRHPVSTHWPEIARVLRPDGTYLSQQVGAGSIRELTDAMMGPQPVSDRRSARRAAEQASAAGLHVVDLRQTALRAEFNDIAAVVVFLRKVVWTVPGFTVDRYRRPLARLHDRIEAGGPFVAHAQRFLIEARRPH